MKSLEISAEIKRCLAALTRDMAHMSDQNQAAFAAILPILSSLHRDDSDARAVLLVDNSVGHTMIRINADEYEANALLYQAIPFHQELLNANRPEILN